MKRITKWIAIAVVLILAAFGLYLLLWPVNLDPEAWTPPPAPPASGVYAVNNRLTRVEKLLEGYYAPESVAIGADGSIYTGLFDGRILRISPDGKEVEVLTQAVEPLGVELDAQGNLIVADASLGLISVDKTGAITELTREVAGTPINFADDLAIASDGTIYFSDASTKFTNLESFADIFEHRPNGRLLAYDPASGETRLVQDRLYFPNGVALSPDESCLLFNETSLYRVSCYWLSGSKAGQMEVFIDNLPGFPDNITFNGKDTYWVALFSGPKARASLDPLLPYPYLRKVLWHLPGLLTAGSAGEGYILGLDLNGNVIHNLQDPAGQVYPNTTSALESDSVLYIGGYADGLGRIPVP
jgi:sugar lactone lactonase YvrE